MGMPQLYKRAVSLGTHHAFTVICALMGCSDERADSLLCLLNRRLEGFAVISDSICRFPEYQHEAHGQAGIRGVRRCIFCGLWVAERP